MRRKGICVIFGFTALLFLGGCIPETGQPLSTQDVTPQLLSTPTQVEIHPTSFFITSTPVSTSDPHIAGANCEGCHIVEHKRWATTLHSAHAQAVLTNEQHNKTELLSDECLFCHAPFQAGEYNVSSFVQPIDQVGPWELNIENAVKWEAIKCETCHNPTSRAPKKLAFFDAMEGDYVPVKDTTELCEKCHKAGTDDSRTLKGSVHEGLQCGSCHLQKGAEMNLDPTLACTQCHPKANPKHPDVTTLDTTLISLDSRNDIHFVKCETCHPNGLPTTNL